MSSIKDKRLRREIERLPFEVVWDDGDNVIYVPEHSLTITVCDWYPFRFPIVQIGGVSQEEFVKNFETTHGVAVDLSNTYTSRWCPVFGLKEVVDDYLKLAGRMEMARKS